MLFRSVDSGFQVPADKVVRAAQPGPRPNGEPMTPRFAVNDGARYESGGGGMVSTMEDYLRFTTMLANNGELSGKRLLGKQTLAFMTADHVGNRPGRPPGLGFGLACAIAIGLAMRAQLFGIGVADPATLLGVVALISGTALVACWEAYSNASKKDTLTVTIGLKSSYIASEYEDETGSFSIKLDPAVQMPPGPEASADACVRAVVEPAIKELKTLRDAFATKLTITIK